MVDQANSPYFDDYSAEKNYHKILFVPSRAVQVRELNQLQTIIQEQIKRFGNHIFENGSMVLPGEINFDLQYEFVKVTGVVYADIVDTLTTNEVTITGATSGIVARIVQHIDVEGTDPITFYLQYHNSGTDEETKRFILGETLSLKNELGVEFDTAIAGVTGAGSILTINSGVFYINGFFVQTSAQDVILSKYTSTPSVVAGFRLVESDIEWTEDNTLLDNANGSTNFNGIGANRLKLELVTEVHDIDVAFDEENFIRLISFRNGVLQKKVRGPEYSTLLETLARRTYEQAGDYTVTAFGINIREHLDDGTNNGLFLAPTGDESKFVVGVEPGKAVVRGFEVENIITEYIETTKAREVGNVNNSTFSAPLGNFIEVDTMNIVPSSNQLQTISFYSGTPASPGSVPSGTVLGSARVRYALLDVAPTPDRLKLYLFDVKDAAGISDSSFIDTAQSVYAAGSPAFTALVKSELQDSVNYGLVYELPVDNVKTLLDLGVSDTSVSVVRQYQLTTDTNGVVVLTAGSNEVFATPASTNSVASYTITGTSTTREIATISTLGGVPSGSTLTIDFGSGVASTVVTINVEVIKQVAIQKNKTVTNTSIVLAPGAAVGGKFFLNKADAIRINSVTENAVDKTFAYTLTKNSNPEFYGVSYITVNTGEAFPTSNITIDFDYFNHGAGDFFSVDSYSTINYGDIPTEIIAGTEIKLSDVIDFRPRINDAGTGFSGTGSSVTDIPFNGSLIRADIDFYLPRIDKVVVDSKGVFNVVKGVPAIEPKEPKTPDNSMLLYRLQIPAYTADVRDILTEFVNNRRYTMRDIGYLEDRIATLEYYTSLNLLETETTTMQILDQTTGLDRFKNGFVADNFVDHSVGSFTLPEYKCSISSEEQILRSEFSVDQVSMLFNSGLSSNVTKTGDLVTLPYTEVLFLSQLDASNFLNVNPYAVYRWNGQLNLTPNSDTWYDSVYTEPQVAYRVFNNGNLTQSWNSWGLNWAGGVTKSSLYNLGGTDKFSATPGGFTDTSHSRVGSVTTTTSNVSIEVVNDKVVSTSIIPFMRSIDIQFSAKGLKPSSKVFPFFDNVEVSAHCKPTGGSFGGDIVTDVDGSVTGTFKVPNSNALKFRTGTKQFTLNDNNGNVKETSLSYADAYFTAKGLLQTRTQSIVATQSITKTVKPWDPLAQSFFVEQEGGAFLTSIEVYFASKDSLAPVNIEIRNMVNGFPGQDVVPYSQVLLNPSEVSVSANASVSTKFTFPSPVYLANGNEYCFVLMSNSNNYNVYIGTLGNKVIGTTRYISKQPFVGVLFKSQNNTTWSEDQNSDMKFKINRASFSTGIVGQAAFINDNPAVINLQNNPLVSTNASNVVTVNFANHNLFVGSKFTIGGVVTAPGIPVGEINGIRTVTAVIDLDQFQFTTTTNATSTGSFGGALVTADRNMILNTAHPIVQELLLENTDVNWTLAGTAGKSLSGTESPYQPIAAISVNPNENVDFSVPYLIASSSESVNVVGPSAKIVANMQTFSENISPVIDSNRCGLIGVVNRINSPAVLTETTANGGNSVSRYLTKVIGLKNAANSLKVFVDINKPQSSDVKVFYRVGNTEEEVNSKAWSSFTTITSVVASDSNSFNEAEFGVDDIALFSFFQFKIVMLSTNSSRVPRLRRLRGIALGT